MTLDYNNSRVKTKTGVRDNTKINSHNKVVNNDDYCVDNINNDYNNNSENSKLKVIIITMITMMINN